jgi:molybdopterin synthase sulfur carrier subunit
MKITVRYFASIREAIGHGSESVDTTAHPGRAAR